MKIHKLNYKPCSQIEKKGTIDIEKHDTNITAKDNKTQKPSIGSVIDDLNELFDSILEDQKKHERIN